MNLEAELVLRSGSDFRRFDRARRSVGQPNEHDRLVVGFNTHDVTPLVRALGIQNPHFSEQAVERANEVIHKIHDMRSEVLQDSAALRFELLPPHRPVGIHAARVQVSRAEADHVAHEPLVD